MECLEHDHSDIYVSLWKFEPTNNRHWVQNFGTCLYCWRNKSLTHFIFHKIVPLVLYLITTRLRIQMQTRASVKYPRNCSCSFKISRWPSSGCFVKSTFLVSLSKIVSSWSDIFEYEFLSTVKYCIWL